MHATSAEAPVFRAIRSSALARYGIAVAVAAFSILLRLALDPVWGVRFPYITLFPAIMLSAWLGGFWPGMITTLISGTAATYFWIEPAGSWVVTEKSELLGVVLFVAVGLVICALNEAWRRAAIAVGQSEERLKITLLGIGDAVIATDEQARVARLNPVAQALTGWNEEDALGQPLADVFVIINEQSRRPADNPVPRVLREGTVAGLANHTVLVSRDGREIPIDDSAAPIRAADGAIVGAVLIFRDITERRRGERERGMLLEKERAARLEAERLSEDLLHLQGVTDIALSSLPAPALMSELLQRVCAALKSDSATVFLLDADGQHLSPVASHGFGEQFGERSRIPFGHGVAGRIAAARQGMIVDDVSDVEVLDPFLRDHVKSLIGAPLQLDNRIVGVVHVGTVAPRRFTQSDLRLLSLVAERLALAFERQQAEERFRVAVEAAPTAMLMIDSQGEIVLVNQLTEQLFGYTRTELLGKTIEQLVPQRLRGNHEEYRRGFLTDAQQRSMGVGRDLYALRKDGREIPVEIGLSPVQMDGGLCVIAAVSDITQRKRTEEALREADRRKDEFLAMLSHELRNPINAVIGWAQILRTGGLPSERVRHALEIVERNAHVEARLVESLLDVSRISAGKLEFEMGRVDVTSVVQAAVDAIRLDADAKGISLEPALALSPIFVVGDAGRLQQVMSNLLSNAVKFTPKGGHVAVRVEHADSQVRIQVADDGEGISPEFLPVVFDRFRQAETGKDRRHAGLGLGLTIVREFVHAHGGSVSADSAGLGNGSTFTVMLPIRAVATAPNERNGEHGEESSTHSVAGLQVLVVDDDRDARELLALTLESQGAVVRTASSAAEALELIEGEKVHLLLADIGMPGEDGYTLVRKLRDLERDQRRRRLPTIAVTSYATAHDREQALAAGYDLHLAKPVDPNTLMHAVARFAAAV
jgi:PAS domain S-box-containing protein